MGILGDVTIGHIMKGDGPELGEEGGRDLPFSWTS